MTQPTQQEKPKRAHRATFSRDNRKGGYIIRVEGPNAEGFAGREVPVTTRAGEEQMEKLEKLIWVGKDRETGAKIALYSFVAKPRGEVDIEF